jgi:GH25 family lysozyme M1 (1,4-beta-N-acetylmuramidase)
MSQKLILPINKSKLTASMKTAAYKSKFGFEHYGIDMVSTAGDTTVWASGNGTVVAAGNDSVVGNVVAVLYPDAVNHKTGAAQGVVLRYYHLASIAVKVGQSVDKDCKLGQYGNTGSMSMALHLHLEADTDTAHPLYSPTVNRSSFLKGRSAGANDKTMSTPLDWLHCKSDSPDNQTYTTAADAYITPADKSIPMITGALADPGIRIEGIDISAHNGTVDFSRVKAAGKEFAFIRLGWAGWDGKIEANGGLDKCFHTNMAAAVSSGLHVGVYLYSYCKTPEAARIAAQETLELVKPYTLTYPIAFDIEDTSDTGTRYDQMSRANNSEIVAAYLSTIQRGGYYPILYTYTAFAQSYLDMAALTEWDVWIAQYATAVTYPGDYSIWQYKGDVPGFVGSCPGVTGACDLNVSYKDYAALISASGLNVSGDSEQDDDSELETLRKEKAAWEQERTTLQKQINDLEAIIKKMRDTTA